MDVCDPLQISAPLAINGNASATPSSLPDQILRIADSHRRWVLAGIVVLYLLGFNAQWRVERDSALYLTIAGNLVNGSGYTYLGQPQHLVFPGLPLLFAGMSRLFHTSSVVPDLVLMLLMGFATLALTYRLFLLHAGRPTAVLMTFGLAVSRLFYRYCFELLSDLPFFLGVMAFLVGYEAVFAKRAERTSVENSLSSGRATAKWFDWALLLAGLALAVVMRPTMWILLVAIALATAWNFIRSVNRSSIAWTHLALAVLVIVAAILFFMMDPRRGGSVEVGEYEDYILNAKLGHLSETLRQAFTSNIPELFESSLCKGLFGCPIAPGVNTLVGIFIVGLSCWLLWYRPLWGLWPLLTIGALLVFKPVDRYLLPVIPLLIFAWWRFLVWLHGRLARKWADLVFLILLIAGACTNLARLSQFMVEQRRVPFLAHYHDARYVSLYQVANLIRQHLRKTDWVVAGPKVARPMTYASRRNVIKVDDNLVLDPNATGVYALMGPSWEDEGRQKSSRPDDLVPQWLARNGFQIGPQIGPAILNEPEKERWTLHRVLPNTPGR